MIKKKFISMMVVVCIMLSFQGFNSSIAGGSSSAQGIKVGWSTIDITPSGTVLNWGWNTNVSNCNSGFQMYIGKHKNHAINFSLSPHHFRENKNGNL